MVSCSDNRMTLVLNAEKVDGLMPKERIKYNGFEIGEVSEFFIEEDNTITVLCKIKEEIQIPSDSKFNIVDADLFGRKEIEVTFGKSETYFISGDKGTLVIEEKKIDALGTRFNEILGMPSAAKQDSILKELKKLNENLEGLSRSQK